MFYDCTGKLAIQAKVYGKNSEWREVDSIRLIKGGYLFDYDDLGRMVMAKSGNLEVYDADEKNRLLW